MILEVRDGTFGYGGKPVLDHLSLTVPENKVLTVLGKNGMGKTTLLKCMMGFLRWKSGATWLDGKPLADYPHREVWRRISYVPQAKRSPFAFSVIDTVVMGLNAEGGMFSVPSHEDYDRAYAVLRTLGIEQIASRDCGAISGGELQMALIARALVSDPRILILDEPESNLDMRNQLRVLEAIERVAAKGDTTCVINTHFPEHALSVSDETLFLGPDGQRLLGPTAEVVSEDNIRRFYQVDAKVVPVSVDVGERRTVYPYRIV